MGQWDNNEKTIYRYTLSDQWSLNDFLKQSEQGSKEIRSVDHPVCLILEIQGKLYLPPGFLRSVMNLQSKSTPNRALIVVVGLDSLIGTIFNLLRTIAPPFFRDIRRAETLEAAYAIIHAHQEKNVRAANGDS